MNGSAKVAGAADERPADDHTRQRAVAVNLPGILAARTLDSAGDAHRSHCPRRKDASANGAGAADERAADDHTRQRAVAANLPGILAARTLDSAGDANRSHGPR